MRDVERDVRGDERLEGGFAVKKPPGQGEKQRRTGARQHQQRVDERVGFRQSAVEIDAERRKGHSRSFRQRDDLGQSFTSARAYGSCFDDKTGSWVGGWDEGKFGGAERDRT